MSTDLLSHITPDASAGIASAPEPGVEERLKALAIDAGTVVGVEDVLRLGRTYLAVDVAFIGRVEDGQRHLRAVSAVDASLEALAGSADPLEGSHCELVLAGSVDAVIPDALADPLVVSVQATHDYAVRAFVGVPITLPDGEVYGTLCDFSHVTRPDLDGSSESVLRFLADLVAVPVDVEHAGGKSRREVRRHLERVLETGQPTMVFQPIVRLVSGHVTGYEALARFECGPSLPPNEWFEAADEVGLGATLEALAITRALDCLHELPASVRMSVNTSAQHLVSLEVHEAFADHDLSRVVVELIKYERDVDRGGVLEAFEWLRLREAKIALDDVGSGYSGLERVVRLGPDRIKLDQSLVADLDRPLPQQAMVAATVSYAHRVGAEIVAEGIETMEELAMLRELKVDLGQGYLLARPDKALLSVAALDGFAQERRAA